MAMRDESTFPTNNAAEMGVDPAIERARQAGEGPPDEPEEPTIRQELDYARDRLLEASGHLARVKHRLRVIRSHPGLPSWIVGQIRDALCEVGGVACGIDCAMGNIACSAQIAEEEEVRRG